MAQLSGWRVANRGRSGKIGTDLNSLSVFTGGLLGMLSVLTYTDSLSSPHSTDVFAQLGFEFGDVYRSHAHLIRVYLYHMTPLVDYRTPFLLNHVSSCSGFTGRMEYQTS